MLLTQSLMRQEELEIAKQKYPNGDGKIVQLFTTEDCVTKTKAKVFQNES